MEPENGRVRSIFVRFCNLSIPCTFKGQGRVIKKHWITSIFYYIYIYIYHLDILSLQLCDKVRISHWFISYSKFTECHGQCVETDPRTGASMFCFHADGRTSRHLSQRLRGWSKWGIKKGPPLCLFGKGCTSTLCSRHYDTFHEMRIPVKANLPTCITSSIVGWNPIEILLAQLKWQNDAFSCWMTGAKLTSPILGVSNPEIHQPIWIHGIAASPGLSFAMAQDKGASLRLISNVKWVGGYKFFCQRRFTRNGTPKKDLSRTFWNP